MAAACGCARAGRGLAPPEGQQRVVTTIDADAVDVWLAELGLEPLERVERDGVHSWDLVVDGRRRADIRLTLILDPRSAIVCWLHFAPALNDSFRVSYRQLLRWNDELPFVKFALAGDDDRVVLSAEVAADRVDRHALGLSIARLLAVCDLTLDRAVAWLWPGARRAPAMGRPSRQTALLDRYADEIAEFAGRERDAGAVELD